MKKKKSIEFWDNLKKEENRRNKNNKFNRKSSNVKMTFTDEEEYKIRRIREGGGLKQEHSSFRWQVPGGVIHDQHPYGKSSRILSDTR